MSQDKPDLSAFIPPGWKGKLPPCQIQVSPEGELFHNGAPLIHPGILELIYESVHLEEGRYVLRMGGQACELEVADTFFVVRGIVEKDGRVILRLNSGSEEALEPSTLWISEDNILYCMVKNQKFPARFLRAAYYQMAGMVKEQKGGYVLALGGREYALPVKAGKKPSSAG